MTKVIFQRDENNIIVYIPPGGITGHVIVNGDTEMFLSEAMTFSKPIKSVQIKVSRSEITKYKNKTDGQIITAAEYNTRCDEIDRNFSTDKVEHDVRLEVHERTWTAINETVDYLEDIEFEVVDFEYSDDYRLLPVRHAGNDGDKIQAHFFMIRKCSEWLIPFLHKVLTTRYLLTRTKERYSYGSRDKGLYYLEGNDITKLRLEGDEILNDHEDNQYFTKAFFGTREDCMKRMDEMVDRLETAITEWYVGKHQAPVYTFDQFKSSLTRLYRVIECINAKKVGEAQKSRALCDVKSLIKQLDDVRADVIKQEKIQNGSNKESG